MQDQELIDRLRKVERLFAGAATPGERDAAADAIERIKRRLKDQASTDPAIEYRFTLGDNWSKKLFVALLRRYAIQPYRYARQRRSTVMARLPRSFVDETLWPEYTELSKILESYLNDVTDRVISESINADKSEAEVVAGDFLE